MQQMPKNRYNNINTHATIFVIYSKPLIYHKVKVSCITRLVLLHIPDFHSTNSFLLLLTFTFNRFTIQFLFKHFFYQFAVAQDYNTYKFIFNID